MSHETHSEGAHGKEFQSTTSMRSSFWLVVILAGLFVAALNFVEIEGKSSEGEGHQTEAVEGHEGAATMHEEHAAPAAEGNMEHTADTTHTEAAH
jgi:hypothetical protein